MDAITTQKPFACKEAGCGMSFTNEDHLSVHEKKHEMILNLGLEQKSSNIFVADQTPTPTRLIKNCEEVGLFEDLRHVNPFDETFRRAVEHKNQSILSSDLQNEINSNSHDSLHTPQVFPNIDGNETGIHCQPDRLPSSPPKTAPLPENVPGNHLLMEHPKQPKVLPMILPKQTPKSNTQNTIQLIQPQVITLSFPSPIVNTIPVQTVKPFILPKTHVVESSASSTPTSALPIKERLKAILNSNSKAKRSQQDNLFIPSQKKKDKPKHSFDDDCLERRRAAALRYRNKIKKEHIDLRKKNTELEAENARLRELVKQLRQDLTNQRNCSENESVVMCGTPEIQIPPSTVRLVMNIPKLVIQSSGQSVMKNPVTFTVEKN